MIRICWVFVPQRGRILLEQIHRKMTLLRKHPLCGQRILAKRPLSHKNRAHVQTWEARQLGEPNPMHAFFPIKIL